MVLQGHSGRVVVVGRVWGNSGPEEQGSVAEASQEWAGQGKEG